MPPTSTPPPASAPSLTPRPLPRPRSLLPPIPSIRCSWPPSRRRHGERLDTPAPRDGIDSQTLALSRSGERPADSYNDRDTIGLSGRAAPTGPAARHQVGTRQRPGRSAAGWGVASGRAVEGGRPAARISKAVRSEVLQASEQLAAVVPVLENLKCKKEERIKQFSDIRSQIEKIRFELSEHNDQGGNASSLATEEHDLSTRKLNSYHAQHRALQKDKVLEYINEVHSLCGGVLGIDFGSTVHEVHPSLHQNDIEQSRNISNSTLEGLATTIYKLKAERKSRIHKMRETMQSLCQLWKLMDSPEEEKRQFSKAMRILILPEEGIISPGVVYEETMEKMEAEVERLTKLKTSRPKEIVMKRRA